MTIEYGRLFNEEITIRATGNKGIIVNVGCQTFATKDVEEVIEGLSAFLRDPQGTRDEYYGNGNCNPIPTEAGTQMTGGR